MRALLRIAVAAGLVFAGAASHAAESFWAQATFVKGAPTVLSVGAKEPSPLQRGAVLHKGDKVMVPEGAQASFLLNDGAVLVLRGPADQVMGFKASPVSPGLASVAQNLSKTLLANEGDNPMLKHLGGLRGSERNLAIAPCRTRVRPGPVTLLWATRSGVKRYAVTLMGPDDSLFEQVTTDTALPVPADRLKAGETYYWEVRDAASTDSLSTLGSGSFAVLDTKAEARVKGLLGDLKKAFPEPGEDDTPLFLTYQLYRENGLSADALATLAALLKHAPTDPELLRWKEELLKDMGLAEGDEARLAPPA